MRKNDRPRNVLLQQTAAAIPNAHEIPTTSTVYQTVRSRLAKNSCPIGLLKLRPVR